MPTNVRSSRWAQIVAWAVASLFISGFFFHFIGAWTGPIMGVWFVGTQKPGRGFLWLLAFAFVPSLIADWRGFPLTGAAPALAWLGWMLLAAVLSVLPLTFHRVVSPRLPGLLATLPFPLAAGAFHMMAPPAVYANAAPGTAIPAFLVLWFAAVVVWMWNLEFRWARVGLGASIFTPVFVLAAGVALFLPVPGALLPLATPLREASPWISLAGACALLVMALLRPPARQSWAERPETVGLLQSPFTGERLHVVAEHGHEALVSGSGERFPIRDGIPVFLKPEDLTGDNGKYNHLYETIGGFYDDTQRVFCAFRGVDRDSYFANYMSLLEVKPGDSVLETSVGTGLNFKYLPGGVKLSGLDLSPEMLANCQNNLRRWEMEADLYLGNAESLPFADSSFDVVFHVGGISFFNDKAKAIREMIRVARPGSLLLIEDETEEYVKSTYEKIPYTSSFYSDRKQSVTVPIDLVPPEMEDIHLEMLKDGKFFAITFRKPALG
jgi:ubiquinone/menaquinone biosynthesis C-methylase UbiE